jgi:L-asparaginase II
MDDVELVEVWRGPLRECVHRGHAVVMDHRGNMVESWGNPDFVTFPRSSSKMLQALALVESGAADAAGLGSEQLALACASHKGAHIHTDGVTAWLDSLALGEADLRCGAHEPGDIPARDALIRSGTAPCQIHNNCSGKHAGFLTLNRHFRGDSEYIDLDHPVQRAVRAALEETCDEESPCHAVDGCSAPNFATSIAGFARGMARFAAAVEGADARQTAMVRLRNAMMAHPELVSNNGEACTELMRACRGQAAIKGGADGFYAAILPERGLGIALKITDGGEQAKEVVIAAILARLGVLPDGAARDRWLTPERRNRRGVLVGRSCPAPTMIS